MEENSHISKNAKDNLAFHANEATVALNVAELAREINSAHSKKSADAAYAYHTTNAALAQQNAVAADAKVEGYKRISALASQNAKEAILDHTRAVQGVQDAQTLAQHSQFNIQQIKQSLGEPDLDLSHFVLDTSINSGKNTDSNRIKNAFHDDIVRIQNAIRTFIQKADHDDPITLLNGQTFQLIEKLFHMHNKKNLAIFEEIMNQNGLV
ncbi:uncharacterized protein PHALS_00895 [Plasmopara halstedii]|uniref:Uncharacterized protein n=1 Tax=Plasmopara halstedii TaxID=4781 RepID=A0A0N7L6K6_PLAHL|nr:uncharacterized protein PHALS_00895 [Plasmopara halstedii]CEG44539.1 hypothetical protein PHALS_00895 [Plasmopara halstedii]|eukprot:XP_024580908.1 hypothetical protein PHALS_00895 [Plasmopara halstedii]